MYKVNKAAEAALKQLATNSQKSPDPQSKKIALSDHWVALLFKKFQLRYLHKWSTAIKGIEQDAVTEWGLMLAGITADQIKTGLAGLDPDWPPTAQGFRNLCTCKHSVESFKPFAKLDAPKVDPEFVEGLLGDIRASLNKKEK